MTQAPVIHKYVLHEKLGKGCFSSVFRGVHKITNREVAIKIESDAAPLNMLKRESKIISYLNKELAVAYIPIIFWYGRYGEHICMATTFYQKTLTTHIAELWTTNKPNITIEIALLSYQIIEIFQHVHGVFILHCDIKPDNFMINANGKVVLIDFGLACLYVESGDTTKHRRNEMKEHLVGSPKYASYFLHEGFTPARRDDMLSIGYLFLTMFKIEMPWSKDMTKDLSGPKDMTKDLSGPKDMFKDMSGPKDLSGPKDMSGPNEYPLYHIMHPHNIIRKKMKSPEQLFKHLQTLQNNKMISKNYLLPYFANVYRLDIIETPDYYTLKGLFSTLY
jgi:serine/threonine protein kinase